MTKACFVAPLPKLVPEPGVSERPIEVVHQEGQITAGRGVDDPLQHRQDRQRELRWMMLPALLLSERQLAVASVLASKAGDVTPPLPRKQKERQRKSGLGSDRVLLLVLPNLFDAPSMEAG